MLDCCNGSDSVLHTDRRGSIPLSSTTTMKYIIGTVGAITVIALLILIFAPKKSNHVGLHKESTICKASHDDLTEQGLCQNCGAVVGW